MTPPIGSETYSPAIAHAANYHRWIFRLLEPVARGTVLEVGVGSAPFVGWYGGVREWIAADIDPSQVAAAVEKWMAAYPDRPVRGVVGDAGSASFWERVRPFLVDGVVCVNVLEHVADDASFMRNARDLLRKTRGRIGLFVPAMPSIFGAMDAAAGHHRRYTKRALRRLAESAGFTVESIRYVNAPGAVAWWWQGRVMKTKDLADPGLNRNIGRFDQYAVPMIQTIERIIAPPVGQSLAMIARAAV